MGDEQQSRLTPLQDALAKIAVIVGGASILGVAGLVASLWISTLTDHSTLLGLAARIDAHSRRLDTIEQRPPRLGPALDEVSRDLDRVEQDQRTCRETLIQIRADIAQIQKLQAELCQRIRQCDEVWGNNHGTAAPRR